MKILMFSEPRQLNGGIPKYSVPVAERLAREGHKVYYASSGTSIGSYSIVPGTQWRRQPNDIFEEYVLHNPRSLGINLGDPESDWDNADLRRFEALARRISADIIHIHSFLGLPSRAIIQLSKLAPVFVTVHEFGIFCQQRVLVNSAGENCESFPTQAECNSCVTPVNARRQRLKWQLEHSMGGALLRGVHQIERLTRTEIGVTPASAEPAPSQLVGVNPFEQRLQLVAEALNHHSVEILAVSDSVRNILKAAGIADQKISVLHIGSGAAEQLKPVPYDHVQLSPPNFLALTGYTENKGTHVLVEAAKLAHENWTVTIAGRGDADYESYIQRQAPPNVVLMGGYDRDSVQQLLADAAALVAPTLGPDTSPQVVFEALQVGRPVVGSCIGGIPDFIFPGINGELVEPRNPVALAAALDNLARNPRKLTVMASRCVIPTTLQTHVEELIIKYSQALGK